MRLILFLACLLPLPLCAQECYDLTARSSWVQGVCYENSTMLLVTKDKTYSFCGVPRHLFDGIIRAASPGSYYDTYFRDRYHCKAGGIIKADYDTGVEYIAR
jgi:hypothetical protein